MADTGLKKCPECAEQVRAEARRCRFCGYRFDLGQAPQSPGRFALAFNLFRRRPTGDTPYDLVSEWGVELAPNESVRFWLFGHVSSRHGYLVVTDHRLLFFESRSLGQYAAVCERPLADVLAADLSSSTLRITGADYELAVRGVVASAAAPARDYLNAHALLAHEPGRGD